MRAFSLGVLPAGSGTSGARHTAAKGSTRVTAKT